MSTNAGRTAGWVVSMANGLLLMTGGTLLLTFAGRHPGDLPGQIIASILYVYPVALAFSGLSTAILRRQPRHPIGWLFGLLGLGLSLGALAEGYSAWELAGTDWVIWLWGVTVGPSFFGLAMVLALFPNGRYASPRWRWLGRLLWLYVGIAVVVNALAPWPRRDNGVVLWVLDYRDSWPARSPIGVDSPHWLADASLWVVPCGVLLLLASLLSLLARWRRSAGDERQQIKWLWLASLLLGLELTAAAVRLLTIGEQHPEPLEELLGNALWTLVGAGIPVAIGLSVIRYRLYDIDLFLSRTIVYGGLAVFIGVCYAVSVMFAGMLVNRWTGAGTVLALLTTAAVAAAFQPLRTALQAGANRLVFADRAAPYELMSRFGHELGQALGVSDVLARIAETAAHATRASVARVTATLPDDTSITETWPAPAAAAARFDIVVPVNHDSAVIAEISVARPGAQSADVELLRHIASVSSAALGNVRLLAELDRLHETILRQNEEIAASQRRLIAAAEQERRQLAQFVAQRLEPHLILLQDTLPALRAEASTQPDLVVAECERLAAHATRLLDEMRALSRGLLPPLLLDYGLAAALRALTRRLDLALALDVAPTIVESRFPPPIESTVYLFCRAALNAAAQGGTTAAATLRIWRDDNSLAVSVGHNATAAWSDDPTAIRDRVTALGGALVTRTDARWSTVTVTLPVADAPGLATSSQLSGRSAAG